MGETQIVGGGVLAPPPQVDDAWFTGMARIIRVILGEEDAPAEWAGEPETQEALDEARGWADRWKGKTLERKLVIERINEPSASGPGRAIRMTATWVRNDGAPGSRISYPPAAQDVAKMVHAVRHLIEHVVRN